ncbi:MAG: GspH/FimT family pseudopilin [Stenotrophomonas chelatiphaga]
MSLRLSKGFTLVELMITLVVLGVLMAIAFPSFRSTIRSNQVAATNNEVLGLVSVARSEAIRNNRGGGVCPSADGSSCNGSWNNGIIAYGDVDGSGGFNTGDVVLRYTPGRPNLAISSAVTAASGITFDSRGRRRAAANQSITITPENCRPGEPRRTLTVNLSGQVRAVQDTCS